MRHEGELARVRRWTSFFIVRLYGMKRLHLKDPDGYGICLQWSATDAR